MGKTSAEATPTTTEIVPEIHKDTGHRHTGRRHGGRPLRGGKIDTRQSRFGIAVCGQPFVPVARLTTEQAHVTCPHCAAHRRGPS